MEFKDFTFKLKGGIDDTGRFTGYAAIYGVEDLQSDIIEKSAFTRAIAQQGAGFPLLWAHKQETPVGLAKLEDSDRGPLVHGSIDLEDPDGAVAFRRVKRGTVKGLSIGFTLPNSDAVSYSSGVRRIKELRLHEISLVAVPAQPGAQIVTVKSIADASRVLASLPADLDEPMLRELKSLQDAITKRLAPEPLPNADGALLADLRAFAAEVRRMH